ncbi:MAG: cupin domain-containing protein [Betaproteobacteria bacterium]|nr:cupin domain-containing protein [Betaproteobacteria bacterium]
MAIQHAAPGDLIDVLPLGERLRHAGSETLIRTTHLEIFRYVLRAGEAVRKHAASGLMVIQCLEGAVDFEAQGRVQVLVAGSMLYLADGEPHALNAREDSSLLVTVLLHRK